jgi:putative hydrolase of the HAD superfamily
MTSTTASLIEIIKVSMKPHNPIKTGLKRRGKLRAKVRAILFDVYGTLFISGSGDISVSLNCMSETGESQFEALLKKYGISVGGPTSGSTVFKKYRTEIEETHARLRGEGIDYPEVEIERVWMSVLGFKNWDFTLRFAVEFESLFNPVWPMPHLRDVIQACVSNELPLGIISNAQFFTPLLFRAFFGILPENMGFEADLIFYSYRFRRAKPSLYLFERARESLEVRGIPALNTLYVGNDMLNDILPARRTGFQTALFAGDRRSLRLREENELCRELRPDIVITDLLDLTPLTGGWEVD